MFKIIVLDILMFTPLFVPLAVELSDRLQGASSAMKTRSSRKVAAPQPAYAAPQHAYSAPAMAEAA